MSATSHPPASVHSATNSRRRALPLLIGLLLFELIGWSALRYELDQQLGLGARFWTLVITASGGLMLLWLSLRALVVRRGWFTLKEFLVFVLLVGALCGVAGKLYHKTLKQRQIAEYLTEHGAGVSVHGVDEPGFQRWIGPEYFHGVGSVRLMDLQLSAEDMTLLRGLPELNHLLLSGQKLTDDHLQGINELPALTDLLIAGRRVTNTGLEHLRGNRRIEDLSLGLLTISDEGLQPLNTLSNLRALSLVDMPITDAGLAHVGRCTQLETLHLCELSITDAGLAHLADLPRLKSLSINCRAISDTGLAHIARIESLESLNVYSPQVTDAGIEHIERLPRLTILRHYGTQVSLERLVQLKQSRPELQVSP